MHPKDPPKTKASEGGGRFGKCGSSGECVNVVGLLDAFGIRVTADIEEYVALVSSSQVALNVHLG